MSRRRALTALAALLLAVGLWQGGAGIYIHAKAVLAQILLDRAWSRTLAGEADARPWPWADTWPVARLQAPGHGIDLIVLDGASGRTLAFGPGHLQGSATIGTAGPALISAHRDTHFRFLETLAPGETLHLQTPDGTVRDYTVTGTDIVDFRDAAIPTDWSRSSLTLVTCYPFDAVVPGGPLRFLAHAVESGEPHPPRRQTPLVF